MMKHRNIETGSREFQAVLLSCLSQFSEEKKEKVLELITPPFDWELFYQYAIKHRVFPMVYRNLSSLTPCPLPEEIAKKLEQQYKKSVLTSLKQAGELARIFTFFNDANIPVLAIKGPSLGLYLYGDLNSRASSGDLDILVDPLHLAEAEQLLEDAGYLKEYHGVTLTKKQNEMQLRHNHHHIFTHPNHVTVELHWKLHKNIPLLSFSELWESRNTLEISGVTVFTPGHEEYLLYLMFHGSRHRFSQVKWLCDIAELIGMENEVIDWKRLEAVAQDYHLMQAVSQSIKLIERLLQIKIPQVAESISGFPLGKKLAQMALPFMVETEKNRSTIAKARTSFHFVIYLWKWYGTGAGKWRYQTSLFHPTMNELTTVRLPDKFYPLYYILRPLLLLQRALRRDKHHVQ